jgi:uncharacterized protein
VRRAYGGRMGTGDVLAVVLAGGVAGTINTVVGTGSLISFPTLLALGVPPVVANASNTTGLVPGGLSGMLGYRRELVAQRARLAPLLVASLAGGAVGAGLLLTLPRSAFDAVVPALVLLGSLLVALQPAVGRRLRARAARNGATGERDPAVSRPVIGATALLGVYGGYFGAGQGVILIALLGLAGRTDLQAVNALKNAAVTAANCAAAVVFVGVADLDWTVVALIAAGSVLGGQIGARVARRLPAPLLRALVVAVGLVVGVRLGLA